MKIDTHIIQDVRSRTDLLDVISRFVELKKKGNNWWGLSPFKQEKTPSFSVNPSKGIFKCFSTGIGGDVFTFLQESQGMSFIESVRFCADAAGIQIEEQTPEQKEASERKEYFYLVNQWACNYFHQNRDQTDFWLNRKINARPVVDFQLGWADKEWESFSKAAKAAGYSQQTLHDLGLSQISSRGTLIDRFRNRAIFPIHDYMGHCVAFGGRDVGGEPDTAKYLNSPETPVYSKSKTLYGLHLAKNPIREAGAAILVEGYTDVIALHQSGIANAVASCGTAITTDQVNLLQRFCSTLILLLDADKAGADAAFKAINIALAEGMTVKVCTLPAGQDPDSLAKSESGATLLLQVVESATDWLPWQLTYLGWDNNTTPSEQATTATAINKTIDSIPFDLTQQLYRQALADHTNIPVESIGGASSQPAPAVAQPPVDRLSFAHYQYLVDAMGLPPCADFSAGRNGDLVATYHGIKGKPYTTTLKGEKKILSRNITKRELKCGVFIPPAVRAWAAESNDSGGSPLVMVHDEMSAWVLSEIGILAVALAQPEAFLAKKNSQHIHPLMKQVMAVGFQRIFYISPDDLFSLPSVLGKASENPFQSLDSKMIADDYAVTLLRLKERFPDASVTLLHTLPEPTEQFPTAVIDKDEKGWLPYLLDLALAGCPSHWQETIAQHISQLLTGSSDMLGAVPVSDRNAHHFNKLLRIHDPQAFYDFHGVENLGVLFQFGKFIYEVDRDGQVKLKQESTDRQQIIEKDGVYWSNTDKGMRPLTDFTMRGIMKIKGKEPYVLAQIEDQFSKIYDVVLDSKLLLSADNFHILVFGVADCYFLGTNAQLRLLQQMTLKNMQQAYMMDKLGHQKIKTGSGKIEGFAFGNGILTYDSGFIPADEKGIVPYAGESFFFPADSEYKISDDQDELYDTHIRMSLQPGTVTWDDWIAQLFEVHQPDKAHFGLAFTIMAMFRDVVFGVTQKIPNVFFQGPTGSGKSELRNSLGKLFGDLPMIMINANPSVAAVGSHFKAVRNAWVAFEEFNVFQMAQLRQGWIIDMVKAAYDGKSRAVRQNAHSDLLKNPPIHAGVLCLGQESFYQTDEAVPNRFCIREWVGRKFTAEDGTRLAQLQRTEAEGLGHITEMLLQKRNVISEEFGRKLLAVENHIKQQINKTDEDVLARLIQNWAMLLTPLLILIKEGHISYPLSPKEILDDAIASIIDHAKKSQQLGIGGEFWAFIEAEYGASLDHTSVFIYEPENEIRIRFKTCYAKFAEWLKRKDEKSIVNPGAKNIQNKLRESKSFKKESTTYMGYIMDGGTGRIKTDLVGGDWKPRYAKKHCMCFDYSTIGIQLREIEYGQPDTESATPANAAPPETIPNTNGLLWPESQVMETSKSKAYDQ